MAKSRKRNRKANGPNKDRSFYRQQESMTRNGWSSKDEQTRKGPQPRSYAKDFKYDAKDGANDISWYSRYPDLLAAAGSFPYPYRPGMSVPMSKSVQGYPSMVIPGIMALDWAPSLGVSTSNTDPASIVGKQIYSQVRKVYSGALDADAPDFVVYLMALDSIFAYIGWLKRVYRCLTAYSPNNYSLPDDLLRSFGFTLQQITQLRNEKVKFWENINTLIYSSRKFTCPAVMDIMNRHYWLSDNVYTDASTINSQMYVFNLAAVMYYNPFDTPQGVPAAGLAYMPLSNALSPTAGTSITESLYNFGDALISALVDWDDSYTISGYLGRAYEGQPQFVVELLSQDATLVPVYNEEVLTQIENSRDMPGYKDWKTTFPNVNASTPVVTQDPTTNTLLSANRLPTSLASSSITTLNDMARVDPMLTIRSDSPTVADNVIATRLLQDVTFTNEDDVLYVSIRSGTELVLGWTLYVHGWDPFDCENVTIAANTDYGALLYHLQISAFMAQFDWAPGIVALITDQTGAYTQVLVSKDVHNVTTISADALANLHRVCLFSEFNAFNF